MLTIKQRKKNGGVCWQWILTSHIVCIPNNKTKLVLTFFYIGVSTWMTLITTEVLDLVVVSMEPKFRVGDSFGSAHVLGPVLF